jgi:hypothetical protein
MVEQLDADRNSGPPGSRQLVYPRTRKKEKSQESRKTWVGEEAMYRGGEEGLVSDLGEHRHGQRLGKPLRTTRRNNSIPLHSSKELRRKRERGEEES